MQICYSAVAQKTTGTQKLSLSDIAENRKQ